MAALAAALLPFFPALPARRRGRARRTRKAPVPVPRAGGLLGERRVRGLLQAAPRAAAPRRAQRVSEARPGAGRALGERAAAQLRGMRPGPCRLQRLEAVGRGRRARGAARARLALVCGFPLSEGSQCSAARAPPCSSGWAGGLQADCSVCDWACSMFMRNARGQVLSGAHLASTCWLALRSAAAASPGGPEHCQCQAALAPRSPAAAACAVSAPRSAQQAIAAALSVTTATSIAVRISL